MNAVVTIATKEFQDGMRNRWVLAITLVFAVLAVGLSYFGAAASGGGGGGHSAAGGADPPDSAERHPPPPRRSEEFPCNRSLVFE